MGEAWAPHLEGGIEDHAVCRAVCTLLHLCVMEVEKAIDPLQELGSPDVKCCVECGVSSAWHEHDTP